MILQATAYFISAYLLGSVCTGYMLVRWKCKQDIRDSGSGGVGATNVGRLLGKPGYFFTLVGDAAKGVLALVLAPNPEWQMIGLLAVTAGHIWPIFLRFRGGRGVATALGGLSILQPLYLPALFVGLAMFYPLFRRFTVSGLASFALLPFYPILFKQGVDRTICLLILVLMIGYAHREHLRNAFRKQSIK